jgi:hypothetical protein
MMQSVLFIDIPVVRITGKYPMASMAILVDCGVRVPENSTKVLVSMFK